MLLVIINVGYKVYKIVKFREKVILTIIFFMSLDLVSNCCFFALNYFSTDSPRLANVTNNMISVPVQVLSVAIILNLRNWVYYYLKIGEMAYQSHTRNHV